MDGRLNLQQYLQDLEQLVNIDSGSKNAAGVARVAGIFTERFKQLGWSVQEHRFHDEIGPSLEISNCGDAPCDVLILGHMDTVFAASTAAERPFAVRDGRAYGPGVVDCKGGLTLVHYVLQSLQQDGVLKNLAVRVAFNADEEISSVHSRAWLEQLAAKSGCVLVAEPGRPNGDMVNQRKGIARYELEICGVAAHAGADHEKGRSAVEELAHWILALQGKTNYEAGTTVNVGVVAGGSAPNVVAAQARAQVDVRVLDISEAELVEQFLREKEATPFTVGVAVKVTGGLRRPPMLPSEQTLALGWNLEQVGAAVGVPVTWAATGGGSDGNFAAHLGVPTLDGLGPVGGRAHSEEEYLELSSLESRFKLWCGLLTQLAKEKK